MDLEEKTIRKIYRYHGRIMNIRDDDVQLPNGKIASREVVEHVNGVCVLPITEDNHVIMVRQYRYPYGETMLELPAGRLNRGEKPFPGALRELHEETGLVGTSYFDLGRDYPSPGYTEEITFMYAASGLKNIGQKLDEDEFLDVVSVPFDEAIRMCCDDELTDSKTQIALLKYHVMKETGRLVPMKEEDQ